MSGAALRDVLATANPDAVLWTDLDAAIVGIGLRDGRMVAVYDYDQMVATFGERESWSEDEAIEWVEYNIIGAYVGPCTPLVQTREACWADPWETL